MIPTIPMTPRRLGQNDQILFLLPHRPKSKNQPESFHDMKRKQKDLEHQRNLIFFVGQFQKLTRFILEPSSTRLRKLPNQQEDQGNEKPQVDVTSKPNNHLLDTFFHALKNNPPKVTHTLLSHESNWCDDFVEFSGGEIGITLDPTDGIFFVRATLTAS